MTVQPTSLSGLYHIELNINEDDRGSFREVWHKEKMEAAGLPKLATVQQNISESRYGVIRGIHAEPWDKYIHIAYGSVFAAIADLREESDTFGDFASFYLDRTNALFVPRGFGNAFQVMSKLAIYVYLVTAHWQPSAVYPAIAFDDADIGIPWPITGAKQIVSAKDRSNPSLREHYPHKFS